jgi:hypothetical protein
MTAIVVRCRSCGREFEPKTAAIRCGTWRDACLHCHVAAATQPAPPPLRRPIVFHVDLVNPPEETA